MSILSGDAVHGEADFELVRAAVNDELRYFEKAEGNLAGKISELYDIQIVISSTTLPRAPATSWHFYCRTKDGIELKQDGFEVRFEDLAHWPRNSRLPSSGVLVRTVRAK